MGKLATAMLGLAASYYSKGWGKWVSDFVKLFFILATAIGAYTGWLATHDSPTKIHGYYSRYLVGKVVSYSGEIINSDDLNAEQFSFKGKFQSKIKRFDVDTPDVVEKKDPPDVIEIKDQKNSPEVAQFILARLTSGNHCQFDIVVDSENDKKGDIQISWRGGSARVELREADRSLERGIKLFEKVGIVDVSHDARRRWIDSNSKIIGASK